MENQEENKLYALRVQGTLNEFVYSGRQHGLTTTDPDRINYWSTWRDVKNALRSIQRDWEFKMRTTESMPHGWADDYRKWNPEPKFDIIEIAIPVE